MSNQKNYNSIFFLTTLSVYLGLVLVGGSAPILAQAALTQRFEIQHEIETEDDLDKKPDDSADESIQSVDTGSRLILDYADVVRALLEASRQANSTRFKYQSETKSDYAGNLQLKRAFFSKLDKRESDSRQIFRKINSELDKLFKFFPVLTSYDESNIIVNFELNDNGFTIESKFLQNDPSEAQALLSASNSSLDYLKREITDERQALIPKNTEIFAKNNQFVIITRLPRGSLSALLAETNAN